MTQGFFSLRYPIIFKLSGQPVSIIILRTGMQSCIEQDPVKFLETPVQQRLRYYFNNWGELRFFRHSDDIVWTRTQGGFPPAMFTAPAYPVRIWLKHYQYRSPEQIERRLRTRRPAMEASTGFWHEVTPNWSAAVATKRDAPLDFEDARPEFAGARWEERIVPAASLDYDAFDRRYVVNEQPDA